MASLQMQDYWLTGNEVEAVKKTLFEVIDQASRVYPEIWDLLDQFIE